MLIASAKEQSTFNNFLQADENFAFFDTLPPIDQYWNYCFSHLNSFTECSDVIVWE